MKLHFCKIWFLLVLEAELGEEDNTPFNFNNDYRVIPHHVELVRYNKQFVNYMETRSFKYNRTCAAVNITFQLKFNEIEKLQAIAQFYKFMSNEYRYFPVRFAVNACKAIAANVMGIHKIVECGNFRGCRGVEKGKTYRICNWTIDESKFPPRMPRGSYMVEVTVMYHEEEVSVINAFAEFYQSDYHIIPHHVELVRYNKRFVDKMEMRSFKYNRTCAAVNTTFRFKFDDIQTVHIIAQHYKFMSNEYRLFPIRFAVNACKALAANVMGTRNMLTCGNLTECKIRRGRTYHICNWTVDESKAPPYMPRGKHRIELTLMYHSDEVAVINAFAEIIDNIVHVIVLRRPRGIVDEKSSEPTICLELESSLEEDEEIDKITVRDDYSDLEQDFDVPENGEEQDEMKTVKPTTDNFF
ncbi:hypothetical protein ILUMI_13000 [Ignelater luminosus]|uniref:Uncharacterized protein n=1 Tax=Ignelater luminosus TaxID=2038154 RepID=A0A8K0CXF8_IGNLU|nr:hypothetical protein ILUMI_13000 [Ignelater luminosus]